MEDVITVAMSGRIVRQWQAGWLALLLATLAVCPSVVGTTAAAPSVAGPAATSQPSGATATVLPTVTAERSTHVASLPPAVGDRPGREPRGTVANNSSFRHRDPDSYDGDEDLSRLRSWIAARLVERIEAGTVRLERGEYDAARRLLGDSFEDGLGRYVEVADATPGSADDRRARTLQRTAETHRQYLDAVREYRRTREAYRSAKASGEERTAARLARELTRDAEQVERVGGSVVVRYGAVSNATGRDLSEPSQQVATVSNRAARVGERVRRSEFVGTRLDVDTESRSVSFLDPLRVSGRLVAANGTPAVGRSVVVRISGTERSVRTDEDGRFELALRPVTARTGRRPIEVAYEPTDAAPYLGTRTNTTVRVRQVSPTVRLGSASSTVAFGREVRATGTVAVDGTPVAGLPVNVTVGDIRVGAARTDADGRFSLAAPLPADVAAGDRILRARVAAGNGAVGPATAARPVAVDRTRTSLSTRVTVVEGLGRTGGGESLAIAGRLTTAEGRPVPEQVVRVLVDGEAVRRLRTNATGRYVTRVRATPDLVDRDGDGRTAIAVVYAANGTALSPTRATTSVPLAALDGVGGGSLLGGEVSLPGLAAGVASAVELPAARPPFDSLLLPGAVAVAAVLLAYGSRRLLRGWADDEERATDESGADRADGTATGATSSPSRDGSSLPVPTGQAVDRSADLVASLPGEASFEDCRTRLRRGERDAAVVLAYSRTRRYLAIALGVDERGTAGQFRAACEAAGLDEDRLAAVDELVAAYERAAFGDAPVSRDDAAAALEHAAAATGPSSD
jgi:hypothetical protein